MKGGGHLVLFPCPLQGHINPMLQLATILHSNGFSITIIHTQFNSPNPSNYPNFSFQPIPDGLTEEQACTKDFIAQISVINVNCRLPFRDRLAQLVSNSPLDTITCIISDAIMHFTQGVADELKLPRIIIRTSSSISFVPFAYFPLLRNKGYIPIQGFNSSGIYVLHRYGPCSSLGGQMASVSQILRQDQNRVNWLRSRLLKNSNSPIQVEDTTIPASSGAPLGAYVATIGFGTPKRDMTLAFDTGSDLTWIQCQPCDGSCYPQKDPIFNPSESSSYASIACDSVECSQLRTQQCSSSTCPYIVRYGDNSMTTGSYARETLTISPSDELPNVLFGCGYDSNGFRGIAGLLGLGMGKKSIVTQSADKFGRVFSYCLPSSESSTGFLTFGADNVPSNVKYTSLKVDSDPHRSSFYFVQLIGISVGGQQLSIPPSTFASAGTILDSGTTITQLPPIAYNALTSAFRQAMPNYVMPPQGIDLETCYDMSNNGNGGVPKITLHFEGLELELDESMVLFKVSESLSCLAFSGSDSIAIIGNTQQKTFTVVYDIPNNRIGFSAGGCS